MKTELLIHTKNAYRPRRIILDHEQAAQIRANRDDRAAKRERERQWNYFKNSLVYFFSVYKEAIVFMIIASFLITILTAFIFILEKVI